MRRLALGALMLAVSIAPAVCASYDDLNRGIEERNAGNWSGSVSYFDKALGANDLPAGLQYVAHADRGEAYSALGQLDPALADYAAALALRPGDTQVLLARSQVYFMAKEFDRSARDLDDLVAAYPFNFRLYFNRANVNAARGQYDKSLRDLSMILSVQPKATGLYRPIGIADWEIGKIADAETNFSLAVEKDKDVYAWLWLSLTEVRLGKAVPRMDLRDFDKTKWPGPIVDFFQGNSNSEAVFAGGSQGNQNFIRGKMCEANFYVGEWLLQHRDTASAEPLIRKAASDCPVNYWEWRPANAELESPHGAGP
jgi:tetratricopeptide (TPR) repeat protein